MGKKVDKLKRVVAKLSARYGEADLDVLRLQCDLEMLESLERARREKEPAGNKKSFDFRSASRRIYSDSWGSGGAH
jgi:predicted lipid-binding transport protein (Tim44 family)